MILIYVAFISRALASSEEFKVTIGDEVEDDQIDTTPCVDFSNRHVPEPEDPRPRARVFQGPMNALRSELAHRTESIDRPQRDIELCQTIKMERDNETVAERYNRAAHRHWLDNFRLKVSGDPLKPVHLRNGFDLWKQDIVTTGRVVECAGDDWGPWDARWDVPTEPESRWEDLLNCVCRCLCLPWVGHSRDAIDSQQVDQILSSATSTVTERFYFRGFCISVRRTALEALNHLVHLDWHLVNEPNVDRLKLSDRIVPIDYIDALFAKVITVIDQQRASSQAMLMMTSEAFGDRVKGFLQIELLERIGDDLYKFIMPELQTNSAGEFDFKRVQYLPTLAEWFTMSLRAKNELRSVADRMTLALNKAAFRCMRQREQVKVYIGKEWVPRGVQLKIRDIPWERRMRILRAVRSFAKTVGRGDTTEGYETGELSPDNAE